MHLLPSYPEFTKLKIEHQKHFEKLLQGIEPYSEFSFPCIFSWDTEASTHVSNFNDNVLIKMPDYITGEPFISILGKNISDTILDKLIDEFEVLKLVPETVIEQISAISAYSLLPDRDQFDYVFNLDQLIDLPGKHFKGRRNKSSRFIKIHGEDLEIRKVDFNNQTILNEIKNTFTRWQNEKNKTDLEVEHERKALDRILEYSSHFNLIGILVLVKDRCIGFSINEVVGENYAMSRFQKTLLTFNHLDVLLSTIVAGELKHYGCTYVSWEQDLGIEGLRQYKTSFKPEKFLKKYTVSRV
jgi:hypothetical protein